MKLKDNYKVIYVYSAKGGVGKTTTCVNLAYSFMLNGVKAAIFDADLSGPSIPTMVSNLEAISPQMEGITFKPGVYSGVQISSIGFITESGDNTFWTGKYLKGALYQLVFSTLWDTDTDVLLIDMPPGISYIHREMFKTLPGDILIITTPQEVSYTDIKRSIDFIRRMNGEILGVVENMSYLKCKECGAKVKTFTGDTEAQLCDQYNIKLLTSLPFTPEISEYSNKGIPYVLAKKEAIESMEYRRLADELNKLVMNRSLSRREI